MREMLFQAGLQRVVRRIGNRSLREHTRENRTPSAGQPTPVVGSQFGDEKRRNPTSVMSVGFGPGTLGTESVRQDPASCPQEFRPAGIEIRSVREEWAALQIRISSGIGDCLQIVAGLRIAEIHIL